MQKPPVIWRPSPNFSQRTVPVDSIILHGTGMKNHYAVLQQLCNPNKEVSAHYYISSTGKIYQLVNDEDVAWHAGVSAFGCMKSLNFNSIGIELFNSTAGNGKPYTAAQYRSLISLMRYLMKRYNIPPKNVLGHSDIAPDRKTDPGRFFCWQKLYDAGLAQPLPYIENPTPEQLQALGYHGLPENNLRAYKLRFGELLNNNYQ